jgi:hypothetical protein
MFLSARRTRCGIWWSNGGHRLRHANQAEQDVILAHPSRLQAQSGRKLTPPSFVTLQPNSW